MGKVSAALTPSFFEPPAHNPPALSHTVESERPPFPTTAVAVAVPVYAKTHANIRQLSRLLTSIQEQKIRPSAIVIDDGSPFYMPLLQMLLREEGSNINSCQLLLHRLKRIRGPAVTRNAGLDVIMEHVSHTQVVCFIDLDCIPTPEWTHHKVHAQMTATAVYAGITNAWKLNNPIGSYHNVFGTLNGRTLLHHCTPELWNSSLLYGTTCNLSVPTSLARTLRFDALFPAAVFEDIDFCLRAAVRWRTSPYNSSRDSWSCIYMIVEYMGSVVSFSSIGAGGRASIVRSIPSILAFLAQSRDIPCEIEISSL
jgi:glycosyltransferase involved in cell wall biosynthesis